MRINNIIICESSQVVPLPNGGAVTVLNKPMPEIESEFIPGLYSMTLSFGISNIPDSGIHLVKTFIKDDNEHVIFTSVSSPSDAGLPPEAMESNLTCCVDIRNLRLSQEGNYTIVIDVDGVTKTESFGVRKKCMK